jgi:hypothetical protein
MKKTEYDFNAHVYIMVILLYTPFIYYYAYSYPIGFSRSIVPNLLFLSVFALLYCISKSMKKTFIFQLIYISSSTLHILWLCYLVYHYPMLEGAWIFLILLIFYWLKILNKKYLSVL